jgi:hypothetical protein
VTRFPALFTTGMHGIEHRIQESRALRLSAPRYPFSPATGSTPPDAPLTYPERDRRLVTAFRSPRTIPAFTDSTQGSTFPACYFARIACGIPCPFGLSLRHPTPVRPGKRPLPRFKPVAASTTGFVRRASCPCSPSGFLDPSGSKLDRICNEPDPPSESARSPLAPRSRFYL